MPTVLLVQSPCMAHAQVPIPAPVPAQVRLRVPVPGPVQVQVPDGQLRGAWRLTSLQPLRHSSAARLGSRLPRAPLLLQRDPGPT